MPHKTNFWKSINQSIIRPSYHVMKVKGSPTRKYTVNKYPPTTFPIQNLEKLMEVPHNPESYTYLSPMAFHTHEPLLSLAKLPWTCLINKSNNYKNGISSGRIGPPLVGIENLLVSLPPVTIMLVEGTFPKSVTGCSELHPYNAQANK